MKEKKLTALNVDELIIKEKKLKLALGIFVCATGVLLIASIILSSLMLQ